MTHCAYCMHMVKCQYLIFKRTAGQAKFAHLEKADNMLYTQSGPTVLVNATF